VALPKGGSVGLRAHLEPKHRPAACAGAKVRIDYHGRDDDPSDFVTGCPAQHYEPALTALVGEMVRWEDKFGGLEGATKRAVLDLPAPLVSFYLDCQSAQSRFSAWRDKAAAKALERK
jgi:hypothetical protein